ncbi:MAG: hypothetical protein WA108_04755, partial [Thiobacillus sp.]
TPLSTGHLALDFDGFTLDNSGTAKEGVGRTYMGFDGYAPIAGCLAAVSTPVSAARFRSNVVRVGMLKSSPRPRSRPAQNVIPVGDGRVRQGAGQCGGGCFNLAQHCFLVSVVERRTTAFIT